MLELRVRHVLEQPQDLAHQVEVTAHQHPVAAGLEAPADQRFGLVVVGDRLHLEVVTKHHPVVAEILAQQVHDVRRQRGRALLVEAGEQHMRRHDARHARGDRRLERRQLDLTQAVQVVLEARQLEVAVGRRVAVTGEVLGAGGHARGLHRGDERRRMPADARRIAGEAAVADHRVVRVGVDVDHRREVQADPEVRQLTGDRRGHRRRRRRIVALAQQTHRRPLGPRRPQPLDATTLLVDRQQHRGLGRRRRVQGRRQGPYLRRITDIPGEQDHPAQTALGQ